MYIYFTSESWMQLSASSVLIGRIIWLNQNALTLSIYNSIFNENFYANIFLIFLNFWLLALERNYFSWYFIVSIILNGIYDFLWSALQNQNKVCRLRCYSGKQNNPIKEVKIPNLAALDKISVEFANFKWVNSTSRGDMKKKGVARFGTR